MEGCKSNKDEIAFIATYLADLSYPDLQWGDAAARHQVFLPMLERHSPPGSQRL
jgi:hypothetical protein